MVAVTFHVVAVAFHVVAVAFHVVAVAFHTCFERVSRSFRCSEGVSGVS